MKSRFSSYSLFCAFLFGVILLARSFSSELPPDQTAKIIQKQLQSAQKRAEVLAQERNQLERFIQQGQKNVNRYSKTLDTYKYNLQEAQKVIDAAQAEVGQIRKRNDERELHFYRCVYTRDIYYPILPTTGIAKSLVHESISDAAVRIAEELFLKMQAERPRLQELQKLIDNRKKYQNRILNKYMPADIQKKEIQERLLTQKESQIEKNRSATEETMKEVNDLQDQLAAAQRKIEEIRRQRRLAKEREERERQKRLQQHTQTPTIASTNRDQSLPMTGNESFAALQGRLPWPAQGDLLRPFGEFTHPKFQVKIKSPGIDLKVPKGSAIAAVAAGEVLYTGNMPGFGQTILIDHGNDYLTVYGNVTKTVEQNQKVKSQEIIGIVVTGSGNEYTTFHFEIRHGAKPLNPQQWLGS